MRCWFAIALAGCTPYLSAGFDAHSRVTGPVANMVTQPAATARLDGPSAPPVEDTRSYSFAAGGSVGRLGLELGTHLHDVNADSFSLPSAMGIDPRSPRYLLTTASLDVRLRLLRRRHLASDVHLGPVGGFVLDRGTADYNIGKGYRYGATLAVKLGHFAAFADVYQAVIAFDDGAARGESQITGVTVGIALR